MRRSGLGLIDARRCTGVTLATDSAYLAGGFHAGAIRAANPDVWRALAAQRRRLAAAGCSLRVVKVRAHPERRGFSDVATAPLPLACATLGNAAADALASEGARRLRLPEADATLASEGRRLAEHLLRRFVAIEQLHLRHYGEAPIPRSAASRATAAQSLRGRLLASGHAFRRFRGGLRCDRCRARVSFSRLSAFLARSRCQGHLIARSGWLAYVPRASSVAPRVRRACGAP